MDNKGYKILKNIELDSIFNLIINTPGITIKELAAKRDTESATVSKQVSIMEINGVIRTEYLKKNGVIIRKCYVSSKVFYEQIAKSYDIELGEIVYENIDRFILHPKILNIIFDVRKKTMDSKNYLAVLSTSLMVFTQKETLDIVRSMMKKDPALQEYFDKGFQVFVDKLKKKVMKS